MFKDYVDGPPGAVVCFYYLAYEDIYAKKISIEWALPKLKFISVLSGCH